MARNSGVTGGNVRIYDPRKNETPTWLQKVQKDLDRVLAWSNKQKTSKGVGNWVLYKHVEPKTGPVPFGPNRPVRKSR